MWDILHIDQNQFEPSEGLRTCLKHIASLLDRTMLNRMSKACSLLRDEGLKRIGPWRHDGRNFLMAVMGSSNKLSDRAQRVR